MTATKNPLGAIIVDDEQLARHAVRELLSAHSEVQILAECANGIEAVKAVTEHKPALIFLDVQMPKLSGFDVLELINTDAAVIFTTAFDQYAMRAFEVHAVDYLLKPIGRERFETALAHAKSRIDKKSPAPRWPVREKNISSSKPSRASKLAWTRNASYAYTAPTL